MQVNILIPYVFIKLLKREESKKVLIEILDSIFDYEEKIIDLKLIDNTIFNNSLVSENNRIDTICYFSNGISKYVTIQIVNSILSLDNTFKFFRQNNFKCCDKSNFANKFICITFIKSNFLVSKNYHSIYETRYRSYNLIDELHFIEFNKFNKFNSELLDIDSISSLSSLDKWLIFFKYNYSYLSRLLEDNNENMRDLKTYFYKLKSKSTFKNTYEIFEKAMYDEISVMESSKEEGIKEGLEKGKKEVVKKSLIKGFSIEDISEITGLSKEEIIKIKSEL